jgi:hypothetical protein
LVVIPAGDLLLLSPLHFFLSFPINESCTFMHFPDDENGDVLRRMQAHGADLTYPRNIDFTVVFPDQQSAEKFASKMIASGHTASAAITQTRDQFPWDVLIVKHMIPTHKDITEFETFLEREASVHGGKNDGWGSISQQ